MSCHAFLQGMTWHGVFWFVSLIGSPPPPGPGGRLGAGMPGQENRFCDFLGWVFRPSADLPSVGLGVGLPGDENRSCGFRHCPPLTFLLRAWFFFVSSMQPEGRRGPLLVKLPPNPMSWVWRGGLRLPEALLRWGLWVSLFPILCPKRLWATFSRRMCMNQIVSTKVTARKVFMSELDVNDNNGFEVCRNATTCNEVCCNAVTCKSAEASLKLDTTNLELPFNNSTDLDNAMQCATFCSIRKMMKISSHAGKTLQQCDPHFTPKQSSTGILFLHPTPFHYNSPHPHSLPLPVPRKARFSQWNFMSFCEPALVLAQSFLWPKRVISCNKKICGYFLSRLMVPPLGTHPF